MGQGEKRERVRTRACRASGAKPEAALETHWENFSGCRTGPLAASSSDITGLDGRAQIRKRESS